MIHFFKGGSEGDPWTPNLHFFLKTRNEVTFVEKPQIKNPFRGTKTLISDSYLIRQSFQGHLCKLGIAIFAYLFKITLTVPLKEKKSIFNEIGFFLMTTFK